MSSKEADTSTEEELRKSVRMTTTLEYIDARIIENLLGTFGNSQSGVINYIIKDWVKTNSNMLRMSYGIDIAGIRRESRSIIKGIELEEEILSKVIEELLIRFKRIKSYNIEKISVLLSIHPETLINIITLKGDELEEKGLNLQVNGEDIEKI